jgi:hypothetical protein
LYGKKGGEAWLFSVDQSSRSIRSVERLIKQKIESEVKEFLEECDEFIQDISKELKEEEFGFYELEELGDDLGKLEKWKTKLLERHPSDDSLYARLEAKLEACRRLMRTFERKCVVRGPLQNCAKSFSPMGCSERKARREAKTKVSRR